jgi:hypothetical protein
VTRWYEITNLSEVARKAGNLKDMNKDLLKAELKRKDRALLEESGGVAAAADALHPGEVRVARPRVQLELQYIYNESGSFFSHVLPSDDACPSLSATQNAELIPQEIFHPPPAFDVDILYSDLFRLLDLLKPMTDALAGIGPILWWTTPHISFLVLVAFIVVCEWPFMFLVLVEALALKGLLLSYLRRVVLDDQLKAEELLRVRMEHEASAALAAKKQNVLYRGVHNLKNLWTGDDDDAPAALNARSQSLLQRLNPLTTAPDGKALDAKDRSHMNGLVTHALNGMLTTFGLRGNLAGYQSMLTGWCDMIERLRGYVDWHERATTKYVTIGLAVVLIYSIFCPQRYLILLAGGYVLTMFTPPSKQALASILGLVQYVAVRRSRANPPPPPAPGPQRRR